MSPDQTTRISNKLSSLETEVRLKNEQNNVDHRQIQEQLGNMSMKLDVVIKDHEKRISIMEGDVQAVVMPLINLRDNIFKKVLQFSLLAGAAGLVLYWFVRNS